jgi:hypothetical protein
MMKLIAIPTRDGMVDDHFKNISGGRDAFLRNHKWFLADDRAI